MRADRSPVILERSNPTKRASAVDVCIGVSGLVESNVISPPTYFGGSRQSRLQIRFGHPSCAFNVELVERTLKMDGGPALLGLSDD